MRIIIGLSAVLSLTACLPVMVGGGGASVVTAAAKEKGIGGAWTDSQISNSLKTKIYQYDRDAHRRVGVNVQNGEILLTGSLPSQEMIDKVEEMAWKINGVRKVINDIGVNSDDSLGIGEATSDGMITTKIKSALLFDGDIKSINYSIKTVGGVVHVMGIAQNQTELDKVLNTARNTSGAKKVVSYVKMKENTEAEETSEETPEKKEAESEEPAAE